MALHCPAVIVVVALAEDARAAAVEELVAELLIAENVSVVYSADSSVADPTALRLARRLGVAPPVRIVPGSDAPQTIADVHRGETVVVLDRAPVGGPTGRWVRTERGQSIGNCSDDVPDAAVSRLARGVLDVVRLEVGDDGTRVLRPWNASDPSGRD